MGRMSADILWAQPHCWRSTGGRLLGVGHWKGGYIRNFPLLAFWVPIAPTVLRVGGTHRTRVGCGGRSIIGPWQVCFCLPIKRRFSKIRWFKDDWDRNFGQIFWVFWPPVKRGHRGSNVCLYFMSIASGDSRFVVSAGGWRADSHL